MNIETYIQQIPDFDEEDLPLARKTSETTLTLWKELKKRRTLQSPTVA